MTYTNAIEALADPTRRSIFEALRDGPISVGELAATQTVSRPAVSQHLKTLQQADLVTVRQDGTRRLYAIRREGLRQLREYLDQFWNDVLTAYGEEVFRQMAEEKKSQSNRRKP